MCHGCLVLLRADWANALSVPADRLLSAAGEGSADCVAFVLCMMMRFFPVLRKEMAAIRKGIKARGLFPQWYDYVRHPVIVYESFFVPFTVRCLKLSAELGATAELRGLDAPQKRSSMYSVPLSIYDYLTVGLYGVVMVLIAIV